MRKILTKLFGDPNEAPLKPYQKVVAQVNALEPEMEALSDLELRELANGLRDRLEEGETLDDLLPESFAATREAARRSLASDISTSSFWAARCCTPARSQRCAPVKARR